MTDVKTTNPLERLRGVFKEAYEKDGKPKVFAQESDCPATNYRLTGEQIVELDARLIAAEIEWRSIQRVGPEQQSVQFEALHWLRLLLDEVKDRRWNV